MNKLDILFLEAPTEPWKIFIQSREQFTCSGKIEDNLEYVFNDWFSCINRKTRWFLC